MGKKLLSVFLALALTLPAAVLPVLADEDEGLVFDMDLSAYAEEGVIKNAVTGLADGVEIKGVQGNTGPVAGSIDTVEGTTHFISCSSFADGQYGKAGYVDLSPAVCEPLQNQGALTVEFWTYLPATSSGSILSGRLFNFGPETNPNDSNNSMEIYLYDGLKQYFSRFARLNQNPSQYVQSNVGISNHFNAWTHVVMTRQWDEETGGYTGIIYVNGKQAGTAAGGIQIPEDGFRFQIGNMGQNDSNVYCGEFSTFKLYNTALSADSVVGKYQESKNDYVQLAQTMNLISPTGSKKISTAPSEIEIQFDNYIDSKSLEGAVTFLREDGEEIVGGIQVYMKEPVSKSAFVRYGKLEGDTTYVLTVSPEVRSINGITGSGGSATYTTEGFYLFYEDFEQYGVIGNNQSVHPDVDSMSFNSSDVDQSVEDIKVKTKTLENGKTKNYIELVTKGSTNSWAAIDFPDPIQDDFVVEVGISGNGTSPARTVRFYEGGGFNIIGNLMYGDRVTDDGSFDMQVDNSYTAATKDAFGFIRMKYIFQKNANDTYDVTGYCLDDDTVLYQAVMPKSRCDRLMAIQQYGGTSDEITANLSYVKIYKYSVPGVISTNLEALTRESEQFRVVFSEDLNPESIGAGSIQLVNQKTGAPVLTRFDWYDESQRAAYVTLGAYLDYGGEYALHLKDITSMEDVPVKEGAALTFQFRNADIHPTQIQITEQNGVTAQVKLQYDLTAEKTARVFLVQYDKDGIFKGSGIQDLSLAGKGETTVSVSIPGFSKEPGDVIKVLVWERTAAEQNTVMAEPFVFQV